MGRFRFSIAFLLVSAVGPLLAGDAPPKGYVATRASAPILVDGKLDEADWAAAPWTEDFVDIEGDKKPIPRFRTRAKMLWDDCFFYIAAALEEPHVWGTLTQHDAVIFQDNDFEVFIDPDGNHHDYFELEINALDAEWDLFLPKPYRDGGTADNGWEIPGLRAKTFVLGTLNDPSDQDRGWAVELAIPWASMKDQAHAATPPRDGDQWRVNFSRVEWQHEVVAGRYRKVPDRKEDNWVWSPQGTIDMHRPERWGFVQFSTERPGVAPFRPDLSLPARDLLMRIYNAQKAYHAQHQAWASDLNALNLTSLRLPGTDQKPSLRLDDEGFVASILCLDALGKPALWAGPAHLNWQTLAQQQLRSSVQANTKSQVIAWQGVTNPVRRPWLYGRSARIRESPKKPADRGYR